MELDLLEKALGLPPGLYQRLINRGEASGPNATSSKGAHGQAQLMPGTAADMGVDPNDPDQNLYGGAKYLKILLDRYHGDQNKAVEAYNEGMGRVDRGIVYPETAAYVHRVTGAEVVPNAGTDTTAAAGDTSGMGWLAPLLQQALAQTKPDATQTALYQQSSAQTDKTAKDLEASNARLQQIGQQRAGLQSPAPINPGDFQPPDKAAIEKQELAKVSDKPNDPTRVLQQFLPMLAILGGAFVKNGSIASLQAAGAAMNAAKQNDQAAVEKAHQEFTDQMTMLQTRMETAKQIYQQNRDKYQDDIAGFAAQQSTQEAQDKNDLALEALRSGQFEEYFKLKENGFAAFEKLLPVINSAQYHQEMIAARDQSMDPARARYWEVKRNGGTEEEAQAALHTAELAEHPTAGSQIGLREEKNLEMDPVIKAARTNQQYINNIENVTPEDLKTGAGQVRLIDSFTRLATNQAIRGFMVKNAEQYQGLAGRAEMFINQNKIDPDHPPAAPFLDQAQINAYMEQGKKMVAEIRQAEGHQLAQHARNMEGRGVDPSQGGLTGEDLELAQDAGYKPDPSKWSLSRADSQPAGDGQGTPSAAPTPKPSAPAKALPSKKSDLVSGTVYQTKHGPATWDGHQFVAE